MKFSEEQIEILRQTSMRDILAAEGFDTSHTSAGLYFSPFRPKERTPSFHIDDVHHRWYDHGAAASSPDGREGGDTIAFVRRLKGLGFPEALSYLCRYNPSVVPDIHVEAMKIPVIKDRIVGDGPSGNRHVNVKVVKALPSFQDPLLAAYAAGRGIRRSILDKVCSEVHYVVAVTDEATGEVKEYAHRAIGFRNSDGGWTLRYDPVRKGDKGKRSTGGGFSAIAADGRNMLAGEMRPASPSVVVFEGFMDYMSWLALRRPEGVPADTDIVVLNSVANARASLPFVLSHANVIAILDADTAGSDTTQFFRKACREKGRRFLDARGQYLDGHKDLNERLQGEMNKYSA